MKTAVDKLAISGKNVQVLQLKRAIFLEDNEKICSFSNLMLQKGNYIPNIPSNLT